MQEIINLNFKKKNKNIWIDKTTLGLVKKYLEKNEQVPFFLTEEVTHLL